MSVNADGFRKSCAAYLSRSDQTALVVTMNQETGPMAGLYYEANDVWVGAYADFHGLGIELARALLASQQKFSRSSYRDYERSEWPAFRASSSKSIRQFESVYVRYAIESHVTGRDLTIESQEIAGDICLRTRANVGDPLDLGDKLCRMHKYFLRWQGAPSSTLAMSI